MIEKNKKLLAALEAARKLAVEGQKDPSVVAMDIAHIDEAIQVVKARIKYLESIAGGQSATAKKKTEAGKKPDNQPADPPADQEPEKQEGGSDQAGAQS
jgi:hypothetical protein